VFYFVVLVPTTASTESPAATVDSETITLNSGTLQAFEILPSFHLQPTGTPGTYLLQTSSSQGLPLTLTASPTVTLTAAAPASPEQIIVHALSVCSISSLVFLVSVEKTG